MDNTNAQNENPETLSPEQSAQAHYWARLAVRPSCIAIILEISLPGLVQSCGSKIRSAAIEHHKVVLRSLFEMATARNSVAAAIFWVKTHSTQLLPNQPPPAPVAPKPSSSSRKPPQPPPGQNYERKDPSLAFEFDVYVNDGEPNADY